jgi:4-alpha-glucanotransferase
VKLALAFHGHQPVGNFDRVFREALERCYAPFVEVLGRHPAVRVSLHYSGCLLEWLEAQAPEHLAQIRALVQRGQVELMTAGMYEPVLPAIPEWDRIAQVLAHRAYLRRLFGVDARVGWLTERVWEQAVAGALARAGVEAIPLDDFHFFGAGLGEAQLTRPFLTEWDGYPLRLLPASQELRMLIPFKEVSTVLEALEGSAERGDALAVFADDLEKFGLWPGTYDPVYREGWLDQFFGRLAKLPPRVEIVPLGEAARAVAPGGRVYLPSGSYPEMLMWSLPPGAQAARAALDERLRAADLYEQARPFLRGGTWLNFLARYPEVQHLHKRLLDVSRGLRPQVEQIIAAGGGDPAAVPEPVRELWRAECNCSYWHGVFGGVYLPHLRRALFHHLLLAERGLPPAAGRLRLVDLDADFVEEALVRGTLLEAVVSPAEGGALVELSHLPAAVNLIDTLARRPEAYHAALGGAGLPDLWETARGEEAARAGQDARALEGLLRYDAGRRACFVDRFFPPGTPPAAVLDGSRADRGRFAGQPYEARAREDGDRVVIELTRTAPVNGTRVRVRKVLRIAPDAGWCEAAYEVEPVEGAFAGVFAVELNFTPAAPGPIRLDGVEALVERPGAGQAGDVVLVHGGEGLETRLRLEPPALVLHAPVETVSQSESGYERTTQSVTLVPTWAVRLAPGAGHRARIRLEVAPTSARGEP